MDLTDIENIEDPRILPLQIVNRQQLTACVDVVIIYLGDSPLWQQ